jgi:uncharacterized protein YjbI with pentapeptide repeats
VAGHEQLIILQNGMEVWNAWREKDPMRIVDLSGANLEKADFRGVKAQNGFSLSNSKDFNDYMSEKSNLLRGINLSKANLQAINFKWADLFCANFKASDLRNAEFFFANLSEANLSEANLSDANLCQVKLESAFLLRSKLTQAFIVDASCKSAILANTDLQEANLSRSNLEYADFKTANLKRTNFQEANLQEANFFNADLRGANFSKARVLKTNFEGATLTGACIADWQIGSSTKLEGVICDYIFRTVNQETGQFSGRLPVDPKSMFAPGEFTQRFQIIASALETIDITFTEGIDWQAFFQSFQELRHERPDEDISIQGMERKGDAFVVRLEVTADADKASIETQVKQLYVSQLAALEARYEERLRLQSEEIAHYRQTQTSFLTIVQTMAEKESSKYDLRGAQFGGGFATEGGTQTGGIQNNYSSPEKQDLAEAAAEIQRLLKMLEETNPSATEAEQKAFVSAAIPPTLKQRAVGALQSGGQAALEEFLQNPYVNVALAIIEGWRETS